MGNQMKKVLNPNQSEIDLIFFKSKSFKSDPLQKMNKKKRQSSLISIRPSRAFRYFYNESKPPLRVNEKI